MHYDANLGLTLREPQPLMATSKPRHCFILRSSSTDSTQLKGALTSLGVRWEDIADLPAGAPVSPHDRLAQADFVCALIGDTSPPALWYELGLAHGLGLPIVAIYSDVPPAGSPTTLPSDWTEGFIIFRPPSEAALRFQLQAFLDNPHRLKPRTRRKTTEKAVRQHPTSSPLGGRSN